METNLEKYTEQEEILFNEISQNKLTFSEAKERCSILWDLIPSNYSVHSVRLNNILGEKYSNDPGWIGHERRMVFKIPIGTSKKWWQFWKKDDSKKRLEEFISIIKKGREFKKNPEDFYIPVKNDSNEAN